MWRYAHLNNVHGPPRASGDDPAIRLVLVFVAATRFFHHCFLGFFTFFQGVLVAVSLTRIFLILKVKKAGKDFIKVCIFQPTEFNQLDHEKRFKLVLAVLLGGTTVYSLTVISFTHWVAVGTTLYIHILEV